MSVIVIVSIISLAMLTLMMTLFVRSEKRAQQEREKLIEELRSQQQQIISDFESHIYETEKRSRKDIIDLKRYMRMKKEQKRLNKAELVLNKIIRELKEEGIGILSEKIRPGHSSVPPTMTIFFSYDDLEYMHLTLIKDTKEFLKNYKVRRFQQELINYINRHYHDKEVVIEAIKKDIKAELAGEIADLLTIDDEDNNSSNSNTHSNRRITTLGKQTKDQYRKKLEKTFKDIGINIDLK